jgi:uncharacterized protein YbjT (DUF2867 family)
MKVLLSFLLALLPSIATVVVAFSITSQSPNRRTCSTTIRLNSAAAAHNDQQATTTSEGLSRRQVFETVAATTGSAVAVVSFASIIAFPQVASAAASDIKTVVVAGATGQTGSRVYERLAASAFVTTGGVRNVEKAQKSLKAAAAAAPLAHLDVVEDSVESLAATLQGADALIIACGMNPGKNLFSMSAAAHAVDNVGTCKLVDAAKKAGTVKKIVLISSILTNGRAWGQEQSAGFVATNAFGNALDEKLQAELYLRKSGIDYTIIRPGGLKSGKPTGALSINGEDTLNAGEISRDLVADVCVASLTDPKASNKVLEIIEDEGVPPKVFNGLFM